MHINLWLFVLWSCWTIVVPALPISCSREVGNISTSLEGELPTLNHVIVDIEPRVLTAAQIGQEAIKVQNAQARKRKSSRLTRGNLSDNERLQVKGALQQAGARMRATANLPERNTIYTVNQHSWTGKDVRKAVFNSYLHAAAPLKVPGADRSSQPKKFQNYDYRHAVQDARGKKLERPIPSLPAAPPGLKEYPLEPGLPTGYTASGKPGPGRAMTTSNHGTDTFHGVVSHDDTRGGPRGEHYPVDPHKFYPTWRLPKWFD